MSDSPLTVADAQTLKVALERQLLTLVRSFEDTTGLAVNQLRLDRVYQHGMSSHETAGVCVEVQL